MSGVQMDPHEKMRARDVSKVMRGEQAGRPAHDYGTVSPPPPNKPKFEHKNQLQHNTQLEHKVESKTAPADADQRRHCRTRYLEYQKCLEEMKGNNVGECQKYAHYFRSECPKEWIEEWDKEREREWK